MLSDHWLVGSGYCVAIQLLTSVARDIVIYGKELKPISNKQQTLDFSVPGFRNKSTGNFSLSIDYSFTLCQHLTVSLPGQVFLFLLPPESAASSPRANTAVF